MILKFGRHFQKAERRNCKENYARREGQEDSYYACDKEYDRKDAQKAFCKHIENELSALTQA